MSPAHLATRLAAGLPLESVTEEIEYHARRLAQLGLTFESVRDQIRTTPEPDIAGLRFLIEHHVSEAFHQVRDSETQAYLALHHAALHSGTLPCVLRGALLALAPYARATDARAWVHDASTGIWNLAASLNSAEPAAVTGLSSNPLSPPDDGWGQGFHSLWSFPVDFDGELLGRLEFAFSKPYECLPREHALLTSAARLCGAALHRSRLMATLAQREASIRRLSATLVAVEEAERRRIGRDLHDEAGQSIMCLRLHLELLDRELTPGSLAHQRLETARAAADQAATEIRRVLAALSPSSLDDLGLCAALRQLIKRFQDLHGISVTAHIPESLPGVRPDIAIAVYRMVQELLSNVGKHAQADSAYVSLSLADENLRITVKDNGIGLSPSVAAPRSTPGDPGGFGLVGLRDRAALFGGSFTLTSPAKDGAPGTEARIALPLQRQPLEAG